MVAKCKSMGDALKLLRSGEVQGKDLHLVSVRRSGINIEVAQVPAVKLDLGQSTYTRKPKAAASA